MKRVFLYAFLFCFPLLTSSQDTVEIWSTSYAPDTIQINVGETVVWKVTAHSSSGHHTSTSGSSCTGDGEWDSGNLDSADTYSHTFNSKGTYDYFCDAHCFGMSADQTGVVLVGDVTSLEEEAQSTTDGKLKLQPLPFDDRLSLLNEGDEKVKGIEVFDVTGKRMERSDLMVQGDDGTIRLNTSDWKSGVYFLRISFEEGNSTRKVVKR